MMLLLITLGCLPELGVGGQCATFEDADGDGFGAGPASPSACDAQGRAAVGGDCDDGDASVFPGAEEICDGLDNNCDGVDDGPAQTWFTDNDGDSYGTGDGVELCAESPGYAADDGDCNDDDPSIYPGAPTECEPGDRNCDGSPDNADGDGDGYDNCIDCDDANTQIHPDATEVCDGLDNDCDSLVDDADDSVDLATGQTYFVDDDGDGYGDDKDTACEPPSTASSMGGDCNDGNDTIYPDAEELCDGLDNDCDGQADGFVYTQTGFTSGIPADWSAVGDAKFSTSFDTVHLTQDQDDQAGALWFKDKISTHHFTIRFGMGIGFGDTDGADGMTVAFLDETNTSLVNGSGSDLGIAGANGHAIEFDTEAGEDDPVDGHHVALIQTADMEHLDVSSASGLSNEEWVDVVVSFEDGDVTASYDGYRVLTSNIPSYATEEVQIGFTAATGRRNDYHWISEVTVECPVWE